MGARPKDSRYVLYRPSHRVRQHFGLVKVEAAEARSRAPILRPGVVNLLVPAAN